MSVNSSSTVTGTKNIYLISDFHLVLFQIQRKWNALSSLCSYKYYSGFNTNLNFPCNMHTLTVHMISKFIFIFLMISYFRGELLRLSLVICLKTIFLFTKKVNKVYHQKLCLMLILGKTDGFQTLRQNLLLNSLYLTLGV